MKEIPLEPVTSSNIEATGHDPETNTMAVRFKSGGVYHYPGVTPEQHEALRGAKSVGSHFYNNFRNATCCKQ